MEKKKDSISWLGKSYKMHFERLEITQEGLNELVKMWTRLYDSDADTRKVYSLVYKKKYPDVKNKQSIIWNVHQLHAYCYAYKNTPDDFMRFIASSTKIRKRQIFYIAKHIFKYT